MNPLGDLLLMIAVFICGLMIAEIFNLKIVTWLLKDGVDIHGKNKKTPKRA